MKGQKVLKSGLLLPEKKQYHCGIPKRTIQICHRQRIDKVSPGLWFPFMKIHEPKTELVFVASGTQKHELPGKRDNYLRLYATCMGKENGLDHNQSPPIKKSPQTDIFICRKKGSQHHPGQGATPTTSNQDAGTRSLGQLKRKGLNNPPW